MGKFDQEFLNLISVAFSDPFWFAVWAFSSHRPIAHYSLLRLTGGGKRRRTDCSRSKSSMNAIQELAVTWATYKFQESKFDHTKHFVYSVKQICLPEVVWISWQLHKDIWCRSFTQPIVEKHPFQSMRTFNWCLLYRKGSPRGTLLSNFRLGLDGGGRGPKRRVLDKI